MVGYNFDRWGYEALSLADFGVLVLDERRVEWVNPYLLSLLQMHLDKLVGTVVSKNDRLFSVLLGTDEVFQIASHQEKEVWLKREHIRLQEADVYFFHECTDLVVIGNECRRLQQDLSELNPTDPITGMMSADVIVQMLDSHISRSRRYDNPLSLLRISYVFPKGLEAQLYERSIKRIAYFLKDQLRWADQIGMLDRQTFLVILPETDYQSALTLIQKFNNEPHLAIFAKGDGRPLSFSVGLTEWSKGDTTQKMLQNIRQDVDLTMSL